VKTDKGPTGKEKDTAKKLGETLRVEIVVPERYKGGRRYYLIDGKEPGVTAEELEAMLEKEKGRWDRLEIITYRNSMSEEYGAEKRLQELADRHNLTSDWPREFWKKYKKVSDEK
jgi:hypothetical protein